MSIHSVDATTLRQWLDSKKAVLIDVREPEEHAEAHIPEALLLPLSTFDPTALPPLNGRKLVIHCRSGKRSLKACELLLAAQPGLEVYNLEGGMLAWQA